MSLSYTFYQKYVSIHSFLSRLRNLLIVDVIVKRIIFLTKNIKNFVDNGQQLIL